mmetsp:Transcript_23834/g.71728  ORF Transcript_23834/g.71728 Transcript_23834/m.71728 type:complete len:591 (-) Transcript_23834:61-1833(-)
MTDLAHIEKGYGATTSSDTTTPQNKTSSSWPRAIAALALVAVAAVGVSTKTVSTKTSWQETEAAPELVANGWTPPPHVPHTRHQWYETENNTAFLDWKCTYEGDAELFSDAFKLSSGEAMPFWTSSWWPWDNCMSLTDVETLFIPIHGADDDGNLYLSAAWDVVLQELDPVNCANDGKYYVVAPQFNDDERCAKKHSVCQQFGDGPHGMSDDGKTIKWHRGSYWMEGQESKKVKHRDKTSSYDALDQLLDYMSGDRCMPSLKRVVLLGYSGGAQFVQRYSLTSKVLQAVEDRGLSTSVFIGAPLSIAYLDDERPDLSRSERCWNEIGGCDIWPECRPDEDMNLDAWSNCSIDEPYRFMPFQDMDDAKKMPVTLGTNDTSCYSGANPHVKWWSWKYQAKIDESLTARHKPAYLLDNYFANQDYYNRRYAERHTVWLVGTHDGESVTFPGRDHCADLIQGDSHLPVTVAGYQHTWKYFLNRDIKHSHDLLLLPNVRHVHHDAFAHDYVRSCLVHMDCWAKDQIHKGCSDWDHEGLHPVWDDKSQMWICSDGDTDCSAWDGCDDAGIHKHCKEPQQPMFLSGQWRCAWDNMDW